MKNKKRIAIIGGGAAGYFFAINCAENNPEAAITILEKSDQVLEKVRVSGGGRCNVTHACFDRKELTKNYPRGEKELLSPFFQFFTEDTIQWFAQRGVSLKAEDDGRMFPITNQSETIIQCFLDAAKRLQIETKRSFEVDKLVFEQDCWKIKSSQGEYLEAEKVMVASGSSLRMWKILEGLGYHVLQPVPSLFTFHIDDERLKDLQGIAMENVEIKIIDSSFKQLGALLITHWGISGPATLKLSAWAALLLKEKKYHFEIAINWLPHLKQTEILEQLQHIKTLHVKSKMVNTVFFNLPRRWCEKIILYILKKESAIDKKWADATNQELRALASELNQSIFRVKGKSTFKDEFVSCGGVDLKQVDLKTFQSKLHPTLYFSGEVLNIDAVTGGFNFQAAWTSSWIAAKHCNK